MNLRAAVANSLWCASNWPAWFAFRQALRDPAAAQRRVLKRLLLRATRTAFGREHRFDEVRDYRSFIERVPLRTYNDFAPWIDRIRSGENSVLTPQPVTRLVPTSGTLGGRKLIPYTRALQAEFNRAIAPWIADLFHAHPTLLGGRAYWSISPAVREAVAESSAVPIGFEDDSEYLGSVRRRLVEAIMAVPSAVGHAASIDEWRRATAAYLHAAGDLRLISIWHPTFLNHIFEEPSHRPAWPELRVVSCWADAMAASPAETLARQFPRVVIQPKGLLATEGVVTIPFAGRWPVAIRSHFYEFIDADGNVALAHDLIDGSVYEVVLTTGGGLYRYRLGDQVRVEGFVGRTPSLRFIGKAGNVSDRFGEKLAEPFVAGVIEALRRSHGQDWRFVLLAPEGSCYVLFIEGSAPETLPSVLDRSLRENPHYAYCRDLGQLQPPRVLRVHDGHAFYTQRLMDLGQRLGDIKPTALSKLEGWTEAFGIRLA